MVCLECGKYSPQRCPACSQMVFFHDCDGDVMMTGCDDDDSCRQLSPPPHFIDRPSSPSLSPHEDETKQQEVILQCATADPTTERFDRDIGHWVSATSARDEFHASFESESVHGEYRGVIQGPCAAAQPESKTADLVCNALREGENGGEDHRIGMNMDGAFALISKLCENEGCTLLRVQAVCDVSGSMSKYIKAIRREFPKFLKRLQAGLRETQKIEFSVVTYRDCKIVTVTEYHEVEGEVVSKKSDTFSPGEFSVLPWTQDIQDVRKFLLATKTFGGGDICGDVAGGLREALNTGWNKKLEQEGLIKVMFHFTDSPAHGIPFEVDRSLPERIRKAFYDIYDNFPDGTPKVKLQTQVTQLAKRDVNYFLVWLRGGVDELREGKFEADCAEDKAIEDLMSRGDFLRGMIQRFCEIAGREDFVHVVSEHPFNSSKQSRRKPKEVNFSRQLDLFEYCVPDEFVSSNPVERESSRMKVEDPWENISSRKEKAMAARPRAYVARGYGGGPDVTFRSASLKSENSSPQALRRVAAESTGQTVPVRREEINRRPNQQSSSRRNKSYAEATASSPYEGGNIITRFIQDVKNVFRPY